MTKKEATTREKIIAVAQIHFMRDGYHATSTRRISQEVGITQPNLYHHFKNKEALYVAILEEVAHGALNDLSRIKLQTDTDLTQALIQMTSYLQETHPFNFSMMMNDMKKEISPEASFALYQIFKAAYLQPFIDLFTLHKEKLQSNYEIERYASHYFLLISPYLNPDNLSYNPLSIEEIINFFLYGITNKK